MCGVVFETNGVQSFQRHLCAIVSIERNGVGLEKKWNGRNRSLCVFVAFYVEGLHVAIFIRARFS